MLIFILIVLCATLVTSYKVYMDNFYQDAIVVVDGDLTINYLDGNKFKSTKDMTLNFSVTNNGSEDAYFYIKLANIMAEDASYSLKEVDGTLNIANELKSSIISTQLLIAGNTTKTYKLEIKPNKKEVYSGEIMVALGTKEILSFADLVINNNSVHKNPQTNYNESATANEGLIKIKNDEGASYYFRGAITNNYVSFAGFLWRIVSINPDGSVKIVLDNILPNKSSYQDSGNIKFADSPMAKALNQFYDEKLEKSGDMIATSNFCNDILKDDNNVFASYQRISKNYIPTSMCLSEKINAKIGLLTADDVVFAGASSSENTNFYLYNSEINEAYFLMSSAQMLDTRYYPYVINPNGSLGIDKEATISLGVRPVINIIKNSTAYGDGTKKNPYVLVDN